jgi:hypothetical protein
VKNNRYLTIIISAAVFMALQLVPTAISHAAGIGFFIKGEIATGGPSGYVAGPGMYGPRAASINVTSFGGGLIFESVTAKNNLLGYRLKLTYEVPPVPGIDTHGYKKPVNRVGMFNTLTIGVVRTESLRFWVGPQFGLSYVFHRDRHSSYSIIPYGASFIPYRDSNKSITSILTIDVLLALGLNAHLTNVTSYFFEVGLGYIGGFDLLSPGQGQGFDFQFSTGFLFRVKDTYAAAVSKEQKDGTAAPQPEQ